MTLQELKSQYEKSQKNYDKAVEKLNQYKESIPSLVQQACLDMYGLKPDTVRVYKSSWTERTQFELTFGDNEITVTSSKNIGFRGGSVDNTTNPDYVVFLASFLMDLNNVKGVFSVMKTMTRELVDLGEVVSEYSNTLYTDRVSYEAYVRNRKEEMFYDIVKGGDVITRSEREFWKITKITQKCVYAIEVEYSETKSRRFKKEDFFETVKSYVDLTEVED